MKLNMEPTERLSDSVVRTLLNSIEGQSGVSEVRISGFVNGIGYDGVIYGSDPDKSQASVHVYLEIAKQPVVDHGAAKALLERLSRLSEADSENEVRSLLIYTGTITERAQQDLSRSNVVPRSLRSLSDLQTHFWQTMHSDYRDRGLNQTGRDLIEALRDVPVGAANSSLYEDTCGKVLEFLFSPDLGPAKSQSLTLNRSQRRDFIMKNEARDGFWASMRERYRADYLIVEVKNTKGKVGNGAVWQLAGYMKEKGVGFFGMLIARNGVTKDVANPAILDQWIHANKMILPVSAEDLRTMIEMRDGGGSPTEFLDSQIDRIRVSV